MNGVERRATYGISGLEFILHILIIFVDEIFVVVIIEIIVDLLKVVRCVVLEESFRVETNGKVHFGWKCECE